MHHLVFKTNIPNLERKKTMKPNRYPYSGGKGHVFVKADPELVKTLNLDSNNMNPQLLDVDITTWGDVLRLIIS